MPNYDNDHPFEDASESRRRRRRTDRENFREEKPYRRKRRWPWFLLLLGIILFLLPNMIGWFGLQQKAIDYALSDFNGHVSVEDVSLGWMQPIKLSNLRAVDPNGNLIFQADSATSTKPLYSFLTSNDYGRFDVQSPVAHVQLRPDGSNIEDAIAAYIQPADPNFTPQPNNAAGKPAKPLPHLTVNIVDGKATVTSSTETRYWQIDQLNVVAETTSQQAPLIVDAQCRVATATPVANQAPQFDYGGLALVSHVDSGSRILTFDAADVRLETQNLPLSLAAPVLQRFIGPTNTAGNMNGKIQASYSGPNNSVAMNVEQLNLTNFGVVAPDLLGTDQFVLRNISANGTIQASPTVISAQGFNVDSDVGRVKANGSFDVNQIANLAAGGELLDTPFDMNGEIDLAGLIRMLPSTLGLHEDLVVNSGTVAFQAASRNDAQGRKLIVNVDTANLSARRGGQDIVWAKPLRLVGTIKESNGHFALENLSCISDFLTISGDANMNTAAFEAKGDLSKLMDRVGQFADLQGAKVAGIIDGQFGWQVADGQADLSNGIEGLPIQIAGNFVIDHPVIELPEMPVWQQPQVSVRLSGSGISQPGNNQSAQPIQTLNGQANQNYNAGRLQLDQAGLQVDIGPERLVATLAQPVADVYTSQAWNANCQMTGTMAGWLGHVQNFVDLGDVKSDGKLNLICNANLNSKNVQLSNIQYQIDQLQFEGYGVKIREQQASGTGSVAYDLASGAVLIPETTLVTSALSARGQQVQISFPSNMRVDGNVQFKADVAKVADWFELSPADDSVFWFGGMDGTVQLASNENGIGGRIDSKITNLVAATKPTQGRFTQVGTGAANQWQEVWREPTVAVAGVVSMSNDFNAVGFQNLNLDSSGLKASTNGTLSDLSGSMLADIQGTWLPDWQKINSLMAAYTGEFVRLAGNREHQFAVRGPIFETNPTVGGSKPWVSPSLQASASFGWDQGELLGLPVGKSDFQLGVDRSIGQVSTQGIPFAGGLVQFAPKLDMRTGEPMLLMDQTRLINNIALQPETARTWLKYVAPLAADATSAQGNFTVDIGEAKVPVLDPTKMEARGAVKLSNVVIGAGPTADKLLATVKQVRTLLKPDATDRDLNTWLRMEEQTIPILVRDGRVFHENLKFSHKDLVVQTSGSVGMDQSLNMVAQIPIADDWIDGKDYLAGLKGKSFSIPVTGTVTKPVLDKRSIQSFTQNLAKEAANSAINKAVAEKLNPKLDQFRNELNGKVGGELNKLQSKLGEKLGEKLGGGLLQNIPQPQNGAAQGGPTNPVPTVQGIQEQLGNKLEAELQKGFGKLFGR